MKPNLFEFPKTPAWPLPLFSTTEYFSPATKSVVKPVVEDSIGIVHIYNPDYPKGGMTVAYRKSNQHKSGVMVDVAVHVCSNADSFSKKIGNAGATAKFLNGNTIQLPLLRAFAKADISFAVKNAFTALNETI